MVKRIMVTLTDEQYEILKELKGFGSKDAEIIRNIIIAYLSEKSYLKLRLQSQKEVKK
jgi:predicted DNA-binding protein